ncbi:MAG: DUF1565 domain-containing protein [Acidobacteria bacterium]|nr:DUF1565 domain-containing protein [Acidobacteriota bacterium]
MSRHNVLAVFFQLSLLQFSVSPALSADLYVSVSGSDENSGLSVEQSLPSITEAVMRLGKLGVAGIVVVSPGVYTTKHESFPISLPPGASIIGSDPQQPSIIQGVWYDWDQVYLDDLQYAPLFLVEEDTKQQGCLLSNLLLTGGTGLLYDPWGHDPLNDYDHPITRGGAIACIGGKITVRNCEIRENVAFEGAGAVAAFVGAEVTLENCDIHHNVIEGIYSGHGTALLAYIDSTLILKNCHFHHNCGWDLYEPIFREYRGQGLGRGSELGAIYCDFNSRLEIEDSVLEWNTNSAMLIRHTDAVIRNSQISLNATFDGKAGAIETHQSYLEMDHVEVTRNWGNWEGILLDATNAELQNATIADNYADSCWFFGEPPPMPGPQLGYHFQPPGGFLMIKNSILWKSRWRDCVYEGPGTDPFLFPPQVLYNPSGHEIDITWSCVGGGYPGEGNTSEDPQFVQVQLGDKIPFSTPELVCDYRLRPDSALIDAGDPRGAADPDGTRRDIGAYFFPQEGRDIFIRGDANRDLRLDLSDPINILTYLFADSDTPACLDVYDVNDDGELDIGDPIGLLNYLFAGSSAPMAPFPFAGKDPTPDLLRC